VGRVGSTVGGITQRVWLAPPDKRLKLQLVVQALGARSGRTLVFVEKKRTATWLKKMLANGGPDETLSPTPTPIPTPTSAPAPTPT
jgi:superfamily II DNA/RNA helicase